MKNILLILFAFSFAYSFAIAEDEFHFTENEIIEARTPKLENEYQDLFDFAEYKISNNVLSGTYEDQVVIGEDIFKRKLEWSATSKELNGAKSIKVQTKKLVTLLSFPFKIMIWI